MAYLANHPGLIASFSGKSSLTGQGIQWPYEQDATSITALPRSIEASQEVLMISASELSAWDDLLRLSKMPLIFKNVLLHSFEMQDIQLICGIPLAFNEVSVSVEEIFQIWDEQYTSAALLFESQLQKLRKVIVFREEAEALHFFREHPYLIQLLLEASSRLKAYFPESQIFLEVAIDPETNDYQVAGDSEELVISVCTHLSAKEAVEVLKKFYSAWWLKASKEARGKVSIGLECL